MGAAITILIAAGIGYYLYRVIRKSAKNVSEGKCTSCSGHCANGSCSVQLHSK